MQSAQTIPSGTPACIFTIKAKHQATLKSSAIETLECLQST
jgi:hypothetical protein